MRRSLGILSVICALAATPAFARDCPAAGGDERRAVIAKAPSCQEAARLFKLCAIGATLDGELAAAVEEVCEKPLATLPEEKREAYEAAIEACNAPYARKRGSLYRSLAAWCRVDAMASYAEGR